MKFTILTLFPDMITPLISTSILGRAIGDGVIEVDVRNLRDWATSDAHRTVDDSPYGGGPGMVMRVDIIDRAMHDLRSQKSEVRSSLPTTILLTPQGERFTQPIAEQLADDQTDLILIAGHYEGFDERIRALVDRQISIGDFVLTGGEIPAVAIVDAVTRLLPGVLAEGSAAEESHSLKMEAQPFDSSIRESFGSAQVNQSQWRLIEYPHYTRPETYTPQSRPLGELTVPDVLRSGNHAQIAAWRRQQAYERTVRRHSR